MDTANQQDRYLAVRRSDIAHEIVRRVDTVTLLTCDEVSDIRRRAFAGEFDDIFDNEK